MSEGPGLDPLVPPKGTVLAQLGTGQHGVWGVKSHGPHPQPSPIGPRAATYMSVKTGPTVAAAVRLSRAVRAGGGPFAFAFRASLACLRCPATS